MAGEQVSDLIGEKGPVREDRDQKPSPQGVKVHRREVTAEKRLAAGDQKVQAAGFGDPVDGPLDLGE